MPVVLTSLNYFIVSLHWYQVISLICNVIACLIYVANAFFKGFQICLEHFVIVEELVNLVIRRVFF